MKQANSFNYQMRRLKMEYINARKHDKGWEEVHQAAIALFKELQTMERSLLSNDKEFSRNLDKLIGIYQEARERTTALKFNTLTIED